VLDGNVKRVLSRFFNIEIQADTPAGEKFFWQKAEECLPHGRAGDYNQAVMDLGATVCTPANPLCERCPLNDLCAACKLGLQGQRPVMGEKKPIPHLLVVAAVIEREGKVLIARRPSKGLLGGLWEFPGGKVEPDESLPAALIREIREELAAEISVAGEIGVYKHAYTHFKVTLHAFHARLNGPDPTPLEASEIRWVTPAELNDFPMGKLDRMISNELNN
jgi:A/G-specific adenine glycosylase